MCSQDKFSEIETEPQRSSTKLSTGHAVSESQAKMSVMSVTSKGLEAHFACVRFRASPSGEQNRTDGPHDSPSIPFHQEPKKEAALPVVPAV